MFEVQRIEDLPTGTQSHPNTPQSADGRLFNGHCAWTENQHPRAPCSHSRPANRRLPMPVTERTSSRPGRRSHFPYSDFRRIGDNFVVIDQSGPTPVPIVWNIAVSSASGETVEICHLSRPLTRRQDRAERARDREFAYQERLRVEGHSTYRGRNRQDGQHRRRTEETSQQLTEDPFTAMLSVASATLSPLSSMINSPINFFDPASFTADNTPSFETPPSRTL